MDIFVCSAGPKPCRFHWSNEGLIQALRGWAQIQFRSQMSLFYRAREPVLHMLKALFWYNKVKQREIILCKETDELET